MRPRKFIPARKRNRRQEALEHLKASWQQEHEGEEWAAAREAVVTPMLKEAGLPLVLNALRAHDDDDARTFLATYDQLATTNRALVPIEAVAFASGIGSLRLAELAQTALFLYASMQTKLLISSSMVKVTHSIVKAATDEVPIIAFNSQTGMQEVVGKTNGDVKAMELFGRISGIAPVPKGATIAIQNNYGDRDQEKPAQPLWKTAEERLREIQDMTEPKRLPSPIEAPISIGGHIDRMQNETVEILRGE